jgi:hypothetical protein
MDESEIERWAQFDAQNREEYDQRILDAIDEDSDTDEEEMSKEPITKKPCVWKWVTLVFVTGCVVVWYV